MKKRVDEPASHPKDKINCRHRKLFPLFLLVFFFSCFWGCEQKKNDTDALARLSEGQISQFFNEHFIDVGDVNVYSTDFQYTLLQGETEQLSSNKGKLILLNFWATWCYPCKVEMPDLENLRKQLTSEGFRLLTVNVGERPEKVRRFIEKEGYSFDILLDEDRQFSARFHINGLPTTILIDQKGKILGRVMGTKAWDSPEFLAFFRSLHT